MNTKMPRILRPLRRSLAVAVLVLLAPGLAAAQTVIANLELVADGNSRWFDNFSVVFAQLDGGPFLPGFGLEDGFYRTDQLPNFSPIGTPITVFPFGANWGDVGDVYVDVTGLSGTGVETAPVTDLDVRFEDYVADDDSVFGGHVTTISNVSGTMTFTDGEATSLDLTSTVVFTFDTASQGPSVLLPFTGSFTVTNNAFDLSCTCPEGYDLMLPPPNLPFNLTWDVFGTATPVPEPTVLATLPSAVALLALAARSRTRTRRDTLHA
ncbi:MAG: hypothetical protein AAGC67_13170 [Myxococcota bacterium]